MQFNRFWYVHKNVQSLPQSIFISPERNPIPISSHSSHPLSSLQTSAATNLPSVSIDLTHLDISYEWNHNMWCFVTDPIDLTCFQDSSVLLHGQKDFILFYD